MQKLMLFCLLVINIYAVGMNKNEVAQDFISIVKELKLKNLGTQENEKLLLVSAPNSITMNGNILSFSLFAVNGITNEGFTYTLLRNEFDNDKFMMRTVNKKIYNNKKVLIKQDKTPTSWKEINPASALIAAVTSVYTQSQ